MPYFSVVMATYNRGRHILPSIRSVLNQGYTDYELIIVGDCCTDETAEIVRPLLSDQTRWFNLAERGGSQSFPNNEGIARSTGSHIAYLGHDDVWAPDHLQSLAMLFRNEPRVDFAVGGAIYHGPEDSDFRQVTGIFTDPGAAFEHFFPPSSFAHRRKVVDRIGWWLGPTEITAPVDADFLLRAATAGMRFASSGRVTVHKFAAGHRYLSYLSHASDEQEQMLRQTEAPDYESTVASEIERAKAGGTFMTIVHAPYERIEKGLFAKQNAIRKGIIRPKLQSLDRREVIRQDDLPRALDWCEFRYPGDRIRFVGVNPRPKILLPFGSEGRVRIELNVAHERPEALDRLQLRVNGVLFDASLSPPYRRNGHFEATAAVIAMLRPCDYSIVELQLTGMQRRSRSSHSWTNSQLTEGNGIGIGEIMLTPLRIGWPKIAPLLVRLWGP